MQRFTRLLQNLIKNAFYNYWIELKLLIGQSSILASRLSYGNVKYLVDTEVKIFSQWGEDGILDFLCAKLEIDRPRIIEIGVGDFSECNSRYLIYSRSASVVAVDIDEKLSSSLAIRHAAWRTSLTPLIYEANSDNARSLISKSREILDEIDILIIDIDGIDFWVLRELNLEEVKVIVVEYNSFFGSSASVSVPNFENFNRYKYHHSGAYYGASLGAFHNFLSQSGYTFLGVNRQCTNAFFVNTEFRNLFNELRIPPLKNCALKTVRDLRGEKGEMTYKDTSITEEEFGKLALINTISMEKFLVSEIYLRS